MRAGPSRARSSAGTRYADNSPLSEEYQSVPHNGVLTCRKVIPLGEGIVRGRRLGLEQGALYQMLAYSIALAGDNLIWRQTTPLGKFVDELTWPLWPQWTRPEDEDLRLRRYAPSDLLQMHH